jgi:hypothetical protein
MITLGARDIGVDPRFGAYVYGDTVHMIPLGDIRPHSYLGCTCGCMDNTVEFETGPESFVEDLASFGASLVPMPFTIKEHEELFGQVDGEAEGDYEEDEDEDDLMSEDPLDELYEENLMGEMIESEDPLAPADRPTGRLPETPKSMEFYTEHLFGDKVDKKRVIVHNAFDQRHFLMMALKATDLEQTNKIKKAVSFNVRQYIKRGIIPAFSANHIIFTLEGIVQNRFRTN